MIKGIIDRFEGDFALIEIDGKIEEFPRRLAPADAREGDAVTIDGDNIRLDMDATKALKKKIDDLVADVWED